MSVLSEQLAEQSTLAEAMRVELAAGRRAARPGLLDLVSATEQGRVCVEGEG